MKKTKYEISTKIIKEEIQNFLNEATIMSDDRFTFKQRLNNSYFLNYDSFTSEFDSDIAESDIIVTWKVSFWLNQFGIENLIIDVERVDGTFLLQMYDKHTDQLKQETPKNINEYEWKFIVGDAVIVKGKSLYIQELQFDFKNKTCSVGF